MTLRRRVRAPRRVMSVHVGPRVEPGRHGNRPEACGRRWHVRGVCGFHAAERGTHGRVRARGGAPRRHLGRRLARGVQGGGGRSRRAGVVLAAFLIVLLVPHPAAQVGTIVAGMLVATFALSPIDAPSAPSRPPAWEMDITQHKLAVSIGVLPRRINKIVHGNRAIAADTADLSIAGMSASEGLTVDPACWPAG